MPASKDEVDWNPYKHCFGDCKERLIEKLTAIEDYLHVIYYKTYTYYCRKQKESQLALEDAFSLNPTF